MTVAHVLDNPLRPLRSVLRRYIAYAVAFGSLGAMATHILVYGTDWSRLGGPAEVLSTLLEFAPDVTIASELLWPLVETLLIAVWGTAVGFLVAIPVAYLAAYNVTPFGWMSYAVGRSTIVLTRSVHELIFALIFVAALGLGPLPGMLALGVRSVGFLAKTTAEAIENADDGPIQALRATGASPIPVFLFGVVPQIFPVVIGNLIFQVDINVQRAAILGMVGGGGVGLLFAHYMQTFELHKAGAVVLGVVILVIGGEFLSNRIRTRLT